MSDFSEPPAGCIGFDLFDYPTIPKAHTHVTPCINIKNMCDFWDIRKLRLGFTMVVYEKIDLEA